MKTNLMIKANWDSSAKVWVAESDDVPGLVTEAANMEQLIDLQLKNGILNIRQGEKQNDLCIM